MDDKLQKLLDADILSMVGLDDAPTDTRARALTDAKDHILRVVIWRICGRMTTELQKEFNELFGSKDNAITEADMKFLKTHVPDLDILILEETLAFKKGVREEAVGALEEGAKFGN